MPKSRRIWLTLAGALALLIVFGSTVNAITTGRVGTVTDGEYFASEDSAWVTTSSAWVDVPGSWGTVSISGADHLIDARFTAETLCENAYYCSVRVIVRNNNSGWWAELYPVSGTDYAFDSPGGGWEGQAMERFSDFLPAGSYTVRVQAAVNGNGSFRLDDRTFVVALVRRP